MLFNTSSSVLLPFVCFHNSYESWVLLRYSFHPMHCYWELLLVKLSITKQPPTKNQPNKKGYMVFGLKQPRNLATNLDLLSHSPIPCIPNSLTGPVCAKVAQTQNGIIFEDAYQVKFIIQSVLLSWMLTFAINKYIIML